MSTKSKIGFWLLISLIPIALWFVIGLIGAAASGRLDDGDDGGGWAMSSALALLFFVPALVAGVTLKVWSNIEQSRIYRDARRYAETHGWQPISKTSWRNRKRGTTFAVNKAYDSPTYILTIEYEGETIAVDKFETSAWALQFGDWIWEEFSGSNTDMDLSAVQEKRVEWEHTMALARYQD